MHETGTGFLLPFHEIYNLQQWTELEIRERADLQRGVEEAL
jgi:hypothetical protein